MNKTATTIVTAACITAVTIVSVIWLVLNAKSWTAECGQCE